ncbi:hypothetical protein [Asticcacaulis taihuensis]|uniref:hypothetical protein n=1 Tax=Asticcacaulis taihuensis TaxID=260084 RepID=UPI0026EA73C0|nr:hypothetical protein [Asticcacaulis taihuensis]
MPGIRQPHPVGVAMSEKKPIDLIHAATGIAFAVSACLSAYCIGVGNGVKQGRAEERLAVAQQTDAAQVAVNQAAAALQTKIDQLAGQAAQTEAARQSAVRENRNASQEILTRPVYSAVCVDADEVRLLDQAADIANGNPAGEGLARSADAASATAKAATH